LCTHLVWLPVGSSFPSLMLLAVAFENGLTIFHVDLPVVQNKSIENGYQAIPEPTQSTVIAAAPMLSPIVSRRWKGRYDFSSVSWVQYGSLVDTCIVVVLYDALQPVSRILLGAIHFPMYQKESILKRKENLSFRILSSTTISKDDTLFPTGVLQNFNSIIFYSKQSISTMALTKVVSGSVKPSPVSCLALPVTSNPSGLSSIGEPFQSDTLNDTDGILYIYSTIQCERIKDDTDSSLLRWSCPTRRFWLCRAVAGDTMETRVEEIKEESDFGESYQVLGGADSHVICELNHESLHGRTPVRIIRCWRQRCCAVLFRSALGIGPNTSQATSMEADSIAFIDYNVEHPTMEVIQGRDVAFLPTDVSEHVQGLMLSLDASSLTFFDWSSSRGFNRSSSFRPLIGIGEDSDYVDCRRIIVFSDDQKLNVAVLGVRLRDNRACFVTGDIGNVMDATSEGWSKLLPNAVSGRTYWFNESEEVFAIVGLQGDGSGYRNFAVSTSARVLILSSSLSVSAEALQQFTNGLSPLGSFAVCFSSNDKVRYLCCLDKQLSTGVIASLGKSTHDFALNILFSVRPDRLILYSFLSGTILIEPGQGVDVFPLPTPSTRPAMLLEPMIANAVCVGGKQNRSNPILRLAIEKFGRKVSAIAHGEKEGIGSYGAGLTSGAFSILSTYGLTEAASWLLTGTVNFDRSANSRLLPPWLPIGPKSKATLNADAMLHLVSNGDSYFSEYVKSPDRNVVSTLPRQNDPIALLCREYAQLSLNSGRPLDALKILDVSGAESTENLSLLLSLSLMKANSSLSTDIMKSISGYSENGKMKRSESGKPSSSLSALALYSNRISESTSNQEDAADSQITDLVKSLAPSLLRSKVSNRSRQKLIGGKVMAIRHKIISGDPIWNTPCNESKHVWYVAKCMTVILPLEPLSLQPSYIYSPAGMRDLARKKKVYYY
jgi:hypothetical protein